MTPTELETYTRQRYNAVGDNFFSQSEMFNYFYEAQIQLAQKAMCIRSVYTTTSVISQRVYDFPTNAIAIVRVEYDGERIFPNDFIDDDAQTGNNPDETVTGRPQYYQQWGQEVYLRPTPSASSLTIKIYSYDMPSVPTASGTLDVPTRYHTKLSDYALYLMAIKDKNYAQADRYQRTWEKHVEDAVAFERQRHVADELRTVKDWAEQATPRFW